MDFWLAWASIAQVWAMVSGRVAAGSASAARELAAWSKQSLVADDGWSAVSRAVDGLCQQPGLDRDQLAHQAAAGVRVPIIEHGGGAWRDGPFVTVALIDRSEKSSQAQVLLEMELGGLEPPTSWVRSRRSPN